LNEDGVAILSASAGAGPRSAVWDHDHRGQMARPVQSASSLVKGRSGFVGRSALDAGQLRWRVLARVPRPGRVS
jgi:hypothetical protein